MTSYDLTACTNEEELRMKLIDAIGAGNSDPKDPGPKVVEITLPDGRVVQGTYYHCDESEISVADYESDVICDSQALRPFVETLIEKGEPFVTETGSHDAVSTLRWTI